MLTGTETAMANELQTMTPVQVDTKIAEIMERAAPHRHRAADKYREANRYAKHGGYEHVVERLRREHQEAVAVAEKIEAEADRYEAEYQRRGRWTRFFLCVSDGGHVHKLPCKTLRPFSTRVAWLPAMSGSTEEQAVAEYGHTMCTVCFPSAPTHPAFKRSAEKAAKAEAEKAAELCPGSGTTDHDSAHMGYTWVSRWARCNHCGQRVTAAAKSSMKLRKHKPAAAK
jgi:hypothetical protein